MKSYNQSKCADSCGLLPQLPAKGRELQVCPGSSRSVIQEVRFTHLHPRVQGQTPEWNSSLHSSCLSGQYEDSQSWAPLQYLSLFSLSFLCSPILPILSYPPGIHTSSSILSMLSIVIARNLYWEVHLKHSEKNIK